MATSPAQSALHPVYVRLLGVLLARRGIDTQALLSAAQITRHELQKDTLLPYAPIERLILGAIEASACPWLGLEFGAAAQIHTHGLVGNATIASGTLDAALRTLSRFASLRTGLVRFEICRGAHSTEVHILPQLPLGAAARFVHDALLVILERMLQTLSPAPFQIARYTLPFAAPEWVARYRDHLSGELAFVPASVACMEFDNLTLDSDCLTADAQACAQATLECARQLDLANAEPGLASRIRSWLAASDAELPSAEDMARKLHLSPRSLYRHLKAIGLSYQQLVDDHRLERARWLLAHTDLPVERIAERLGYADSSNFSRTFRRWTGGTPREYRQSARASDT
ncbi:MAG: helix-turn-helix domain-containing protein [Rhodanobacteraceae bacterium]|nr:helix-turn-helix domain-containing protein [Rhodanobacteraceae bacterium]